MHCNTCKQNLDESLFKTQMMINCNVCNNTKRMKEYINSRYESFEPVNRMLTDTDIEYIESIWTPTITTKKADILFDRYRKIIKMKRRERKLINKANNCL